MAKNSKIRLISLVVIVALLFASVVTTWAIYGENIDDNAVAVTELKKEGCKPSGENTLDVALMQKDIATIQEDVSEIKTEQKEGFKAILERLPK